VTQDVRASILIVDDDELFRHRLGRAMRDLGFEVRTAGDYDAAMQSAQDSPPQLVVVDLRMPGRSGLELVRDLLAEDPTTRIVVLTSYGSMAIGGDAIRFGAKHCVSKPADADEILNARTRDIDSMDIAPHTFPAPSLARAEWKQMQRVLADCKGNIYEAARRLGIHRRSLQVLLRKNGPE
jgi:two-component system response regulator RegA